MLSCTHHAVRVAGFLTLLAAATATQPLLAQQGILQIFVVEGDNGVFAASGRSVHPFAVRVTDETGSPVPGIAVSFRLAEEGVSGEFANGLRTELVLTGADGRAVSPAISWGAFAGPGRLRVTAARGEARAGILIPYYLSADASLVKPAGQALVAGSAVAPQVRPMRVRETPGPKVKKKRRWVRWVASIAAGVGGGLALGLVRRAGSGRTAVVAGPAVTIGVPTITVGGVR